MWKSGSWPKNAKASSNGTVQSLIHMLVYKGFVDAFLMVTKGGNLIFPFEDVYCGRGEFHDKLGWREESDFVIWQLVLESMLYRQRVT